MTLNEYQQRAKEFAVYPKRKQGLGLMYAILALCGETGELANKYKKLLRIGKEPDFIDNATLMDELSDVLWYVQAVASELGYTLDNVATFNIEKLTARKKADTIVTR